MESPHAPSPPRRLSPIARIALIGCGVAGVALVLFATITGGAEPRSRWNEPDAALVAATVVMALPLGWAKHRPWPVLAAVLAEVAAAVPLGLRGEQIWPLFMAADLLVAFVAATRVRREGLASAVATLTVQESAYQAGLYADGGRHRLLVPGFLVLAVLLALSVLTAWLAGTLLRQRREYGERLRAQVEVQAVTAERLRIARELHDMVAHGIGVIAIQAGAGSRVIDTSPQQARDALRAVEATSRQTLQGLRRMLDVLRQTDPGTTLEEAAPLAGLADLDQLTVTTAAAGVTVDVRLRGRPRPLPPIVDHAAFRIVQESVTNVIRHAGTRHCRVSIDQRPDELHVEIVDAGQGGTADAGSGHGISGMRERAALLGGRFSAGPRPEGGFRISARLPLPATSGQPQ
ncbi:sensor histidine kinase [Actinoallomurus acanthiterrae]